MEGALAATAKEEKGAAGFRIDVEPRICQSHPAVTQHL